MNVKQEKIPSTPEDKSNKNSQRKKNSKRKKNRSKTPSSVKQSSSPSRANVATSASVSPNPSSSVSPSPSSSLSSSSSKDDSMKPQESAKLESAVPSSSSPSLTIATVPSYQAPIDRDAPMATPVAHQSEESVKLESAHLKFEDSSQPQPSTNTTTTTTTSIVSAPHVQPSLHLTQSFEEQRKDERSLSHQPKLPPKTVSPASYSSSSSHFSAQPGTGNHSDRKRYRAPVEGRDLPTQAKQTWGQSFSYAASYFNPWAYGKSKKASSTTLILHPGHPRPGLFSRLGTGTLYPGSATVGFFYKYTGARWAWSWTGGAIQNRRQVAYDPQPNGDRAVHSAIKYLFDECNRTDMETVKNATTTKPRVFTILSGMKADHKNDVIPLLHAISKVYNAQTEGKNHPRASLERLQFACNLAQDFVLDFVYKQNYVMSSASVMRRTLEVCEIDAFARVSDEVDDASQDDQLNGPQTDFLKAQGPIDPRSHHYASFMPAYTLVKSNVNKSGDTTSFEYQMSKKRGELFDKIRAEVAIKRQEHKSSEGQQNNSHDAAVNKMADLRREIASKLMGPIPSL